MVRERTRIFGYWHDEAGSCLFATVFFRHSTRFEASPPEKPHVGNLGQARRSNTHAGGIAKVTAMDIKTFGVALHALRQSALASHHRELSNI